MGGDAASKKTYETGVPPEVEVPGAGAKPSALEAWSGASASPSLVEGWAHHLQKWCAAAELPCAPFSLSGRRRLEIQPPRAEQAEGRDSGALYSQSV